MGILVFRLSESIEFDRVNGMNSTLFMCGADCGFLKMRQINKYGLIGDITKCKSRKLLCCVCIVCVLVVCTCASKMNINFQYFFFLFHFFHFVYISHSPFK